ncbi:MAG: DUF971 domain-containing protein [Colwellia sp.]|nr:DUF971 domain-containing protein [Colwellia sp.]
MTITGFIINNAERTLTINTVKSKGSQLTFEYLRIFPPTTDSQKKILVSHKKTIKLMAIENVGKHGYRLSFDDQHSAIYSSDYLELLIKEHKQRWQHYLTELKASGHSREAMINITKL